MNHFINAEMLQLTLWDQTDFYEYKIASPLSYLFFSSAREKKINKMGAVSDQEQSQNVSWGISNMALVRTMSSLRNQGLGCASASPWAVNSLTCERHWNALAQTVFLADTVKQQSDWGWNIYERVIKGRKPRNVLFTAHVLYSLFMGNSFEFCSSVGWKGSEVTSLQQPMLLQIYTALLDGRICLGAFYISCVSEGALCLGLRVFPASLIFTSCPCKASCTNVFTDLAQ